MQLDELEEEMQDLGSDMEAHAYTVEFCIERFLESEREELEEQESQNVMVERMLQQRLDASLASRQCG
jgi:hypothetical protein